VERGTILGRVLAATYSPMHDSLWVLDEITHGRQGKGSKEVRLIRIETTVESADASVVARLPRVTSNDSFAMAAGSDGALYVAAAFAKGHHSVIQRLTFDAEGRCQPSGFSIRNDRFMPDGLQASERGLTLVLDDPVVGPLPVGIDVSELQPRGSGVAECH